MTTSAAHGSWTASGRIDSSATPREQPIGASIEHCLTTVTDLRLYPAQTCPKSDNTMYKSYTVAPGDTWKSELSSTHSILTGWDATTAISASAGTLTEIAYCTHFALAGLNPGQLLSSVDAAAVFMN